jgi:hypothetical protein
LYYHVSNTSLITSTKCPILYIYRHSVPATCFAVPQHPPAPHHHHLQLHSCYLQLLR